MGGPGEIEFRAVDGKLWQVAQRHPFYPKEF